LVAMNWLGRGKCSSGHAATDALLNICTNDKKKINQFVVESYSKHI
jgi:hypothetical protein